MENPSPAAPSTIDSAAAPKVRLKRAISPELAANVREEDEALTATVETAKAMVQASIAAANTIMAAAHAKRAAAMRPILRSLGLEDAELIGTEGQGASTMLILNVKADAAPSEGSNNG